MEISRSTYLAQLGFAALFLLIGITPALSQEIPEAPMVADRGSAALPWQTPARWHRGPLRNISGVLAIGDSGVVFRPLHGSPLRWSFEEIQTFDLSPRRLVVTGYRNRRWHFHGERTYRFDLESAMPPAVAAGLARRVGKPSENGIPRPDAPAMATIPARHRTLGGGTNGILRFRNGGIDYVTESGKGARSWRWVDIETLTLPDPYHLGIGGYKTTIAFELKRPMDHELFDWLWTRVYGRDLAGLNLAEGAHR